MTFMHSLNDAEYPDDDAKLDNACRTLGFKGSSMFALSSEYSWVRQYRETFEKNEHVTAYVRIPTDYAIEIAKGDWSENESRVYLAIASAIGQKDYTRLGWELIALRAAGLLKPGLKYRPKLLTRDQVDYAAGRLTARGLLACFTLNRGRRFWSFPSKCSREQIARHVLTARLNRINAGEETDDALTARLTRELMGEF